MTRHTESVEVVVTDQRRRRWSVTEKAALVRRTYEPGMSVSLVTRQEGVSAGLLLQSRKLERQGALTAVSAGEAVVPASELAAARAEIAKPQRVLGKKTLENEILKEAVEYAAAFFARSRSIRKRATSARRRLISICSAVTLLPAPSATPSFRVPVFACLTQLPKLALGMPSAWHTCI